LLQGRQDGTPKPAGVVERARKIAAARPRRLVHKTKEVLLFLTEDADPKEVARDHGLRVLRPLGDGARHWLFAAPSPEAAERSRAAAAADPRVAGAFMNSRVDDAYAFDPSNDPYYGQNPGQWHLGNGASSTHANLPPAWTRNLTGQGVVLSIVDDGLETTHPDLQANFQAADSFNHTKFSTVVDPDPAFDGLEEEQRHGTSVAGVAAAVGGNGVGVTGAAPEAKVAAQVVIFPTTAAQLASAVLYHSSGSNTAIKIKNHSYSPRDTFVDKQFETNALGSSAVAGTIHVYSAGNKRGFWLEDSNKLMPQNSPDSITVSAIGSDGVFAAYSSFGANVFVTAPSSAPGLFGILTTDRQGAKGWCPNITLPVPGLPQSADLDPFPDTNYTSTFGGTSSAAPLVAGILALGKQANPNLTGRLAQHALVRSSKLVDSSDGSNAGGGNGTPGSAWKTNGAGFKFNQNYGFGMIDADLFTQQVVLYSGVTPLLVESVGPVSVGQLIPDNLAAGISQNFILSSTTPLESIEVSLALTHSWRSDLEAYLTSPSGTTCRLFLGAPAADSDRVDPYPLPDPFWTDLVQWTFVTHAFWGENPSGGQWTLNVRDTDNGITGTWDSFTVKTRMGRPTLAGSVSDGFSGADIAVQSSATTMSAHWSFANDPTIPITAYSWAIGTSPGAQNIMAFTNVGLATSASTDQANVTLPLQTGHTYYVTVRATDNAGCVSTVSSNGVQVTGVAGAPAAPDSLHALSQPSSVLLEWGASPSVDTAFYRVWFKPSSASWMTATLMDNLPGTSATVGTLTNGVSYDFLLRAVTATGNESPGLIRSATPANLITLNGAGNYASIQAALTASGGSGTVRVLAGSYSVNLNVPAGVTLIGASPKHTILTAATPSTNVLTISAGAALTTVSNLTITGGDVGISAPASPLLVSNVVVHHNSNNGIAAGAALTAINCTLAHNGGSGVLGFGTSVIRNVIAASNAAFGINVPAGTSLVSYCDAYNNPSSDYTAGIANGTTFSFPVTFTNEAANDYTELPGAISIDTGDPLDPFALEPAYNGGRINLGAFGNTEWAGRSPLPSPPPPNHGGGGGGCGLTGFEGVALLALLRVGRRRRD